MAKKRMTDSKGNPVEGLYYDILKSGAKQIYARFNLPNAPQFINLTKEYGVTTLTEAKAKRAKLLTEFQSPDADFIRNNKLVNELIEVYITQRPTNPRYPHRSQRKIVENRYKRYIESHLKYVTVGKLNQKHIARIKTDLDDREVGKETYNKIRTLIRSALKDTGVNFDKLFIGFEPNPKFTEKNRKKFKIDEYFSEHLEDVAQKFYSYYASLYESARNQKEKDRYAMLLYLLLTASRVGEPATLKVKDVELFDKENNIYKVIVPKEINKSDQSREVKVPTIITPFIKERIATAHKEDYLFQTDIENSLPYHFKKSLKLFTLKKERGLGVHIFRALFRNICLDRDFSTRSIDYIMDRQKNSTVDERYYDARLTPQQRFNVFKLYATYEKLCRRELSKQEIDYSALL